MRHRKKKKILDRNKSARQSLLRNLAGSLVLYEKIKTTEAKARAVRSVVEKYITVGKKNDLHSRRQLLKFFYTENQVKKVLEVLGPRYKERPGGYTRIVKLGQRAGDGAKVVQIELV